MEKIKPFYLFFLMFMTQGSLILIVQLPQLVAEHFGYNGWLAIPIISIIVLLHISFIYVACRMGKGASIFSIFENGMPKLLTIPLYVLLSFFWSGFAIFILKSYLFIVKFLQFPETSVNWFLLAIIFLVFYLVTSGIVPIVHTITLLFFLFLPIFFTLFYFVPHLSLLDLTTFFFDAHVDWKHGTLDIYLAFLGFEFVLFLFPYIEKGSKGLRYILYGHLFTTFIYIAITIISFSFNSFEQLKTQYYPLINLFQYIELEFIERIDSLFFLILFLRVFSTVVMYVWIGIITFQRVLKWNTKPVAIILLGSGYMLNLPVLDKFEANQLFSILGLVQIAITLFLPCLMIGLNFLKRWKHNA